MKMMKVLFIMSRILGGKTYTNQVMNVLPEIKNIEPIVVTLDVSDYVNFKCSKFQLFESLAVIRKKFNSLKIEGFDAVFLQSIDFVLAFRDLIKKYPTIVAHDATPYLSNWYSHGRYYSVIHKVKYYLNHLLINKYCYPQNIMQKVCVFLPRTEFCAASLTSQYKINSDRIIITPPSFDTQKWAPSKKTSRTDQKKVLLFVGNDFVRKGGDFLLTIFQKYFRELAILRIVSNDNYLDSIKDANIEIKKGFNITENEFEYKQFYNSADIMLLPTRHDFLGIALIEAACMGLPIIVSDIGGVRDVVCERQNGFICAPDNNSAEWVEKIKLLIEDDKLRESFSRKSREIAVSKFGIGQFITNLNKSFEMVKHVRYQ